MSESSSLSQREFRRILRRVNSDDPITLDRLLSVIACAGKPLHFGQIESAWNALGKESITVEEAYNIYRRYEVTPFPDHLSETQKEYFSGCRASDLVDCITHTYPELHDVVEDELKRYTLANGDLDVSELMKAMESTRKEAILTLASGKTSPTLGGKQEYEPVEKSTGIRGMLIISPPLITTTYVIKLPEKCRATISMKLAQNSNSFVPKSGEHLFTNDLFLLVRDKQGNFIGVTNEMTDEGFATDQLTLENDCQMVIMSLGTTEKRNAGRVNNETIIADGKVSKLFKVTLMNIFDMFDLDGDGFMSMDEYNAYALASGDTSVTEEEWRKMKQMVNFHDDRLTLSGFFEFHMLELARNDEGTLQDCWASLIQMGFDEKLQLSTPFLIDIKCHDNVTPLILPKLVRVNKEMRDSMISQFYSLGTVDKNCELEPRTFSTNYFGLTIVDRIRALDNAGYRVVIEKSENIKWHFISGQTSIKPFTFESELVLICAWVATQPTFKIEYHMEREEDEPKRDPMARRASNATKGSKASEA